MKLVLSFSLSAILLASCTSSKSEAEKESNKNNESSFQEADENDNQEGVENNSEQNVETDDRQNVETNEGGCKFEDGTYSASVDYNNPETGYSATYTLDVEVQDCQVVQINFPNDGYLDEDHISAAELDEDGNASVDGEEGKTYEVHIDE